MEPNIFYYTLMVWFTFYLLNHSDIFKVTREYLYSKLNHWIVYSLSCALCYTFHLSMVLYLLKEIPFLYVMTAPVMALFTELSFRKLKE